jgi:hypothetical protein
MDGSKEQTPSSQTPAGFDTTPVSTTAKSKNADKNEAKRQAKLAKYAAKQAKLMNVIGLFLDLYILQLYFVDFFLICNDIVN